MNNLYDNPEYEQVIKEMKKKLLRVRDELNKTDEDSPLVQEVINAHWTIKPLLDSHLSKSYNRNFINMINRSMYCEKSSFFNGG